MTICAVVDQQNNVANIIVAEPGDTPPENCVLILVPENVFVNLGFTWDGTNFIDFEGNISLPIDPVQDEVIEEGVV